MQANKYQIQDKLREKSLQNYQQFNHNKTVNRANSQQYQYNVVYNSGLSVGDSDALELFRQQTANDDLFKSFYQEYQRLNANNSSMGNNKSAIYQNHVSQNAASIQNQEVDVQSVISEDQYDQDNIAKVNKKYKSLKQADKKIVKTIINTLSKVYKKEYQGALEFILIELDQYKLLINKYQEQYENLVEANLSEHKKNTKIMMNRFERIEENEIEETPLPNKNESNFFSAINEYKSIIERNKKDLKEKTKKIEYLEGKNEKLMQTNQQYYQQISKIKQENELLIFENKSTLEEKEVDKESYEQQLKSKQKKIQKYKERLLSVEKELQNKQNQIKQLISNIGLLQLRSKQLEKENNTQKTQIEAQKSLWTERLDSSQKQSTQKIKLIELRYTREIEQVKKQSYIVFEENFGLQQQIESMQAEYEQKQKDFEKNFKKENREVFLLLTNQRNFLQSQNSQLKNLLKKINQEQHEKYSSFENQIKQNNLLINDNLRMLSEKDRIINMLTHEESRRKEMSESHVSSNSDLHGRKLLIQDNHERLQKSQKMSRQQYLMRSNNERKAIEQPRSVNFNEILPLEKQIKSPNIYNIRYHNKYSPQEQYRTQYKEIEDKYTEINKYQQRQFLRRQQDLKNGKSRIHSRQQSRRSRVVKPFVSTVTKPEPGKKFEMTRLEMQLQTLSRQLKSELNNASAIKLKR